MSALIPSAFLPPLPRSQLTLRPLEFDDLLDVIELLRELYIPPIHGGLGAKDTGYELRGRESEKAGLGLGLALCDEGNAEASGSSTPRNIPRSNIQLGSTTDLNSASDNFDQYDEETDSEDGEGLFEEDEESPHLDPFEREWTEKWLNGVVRRAQTMLEEDDYHGTNESGTKSLALHETEAILREATAVLAMMAGTSGKYSSCHQRQTLLAGFTEYC